MSEEEKRAIEDSKELINELEKHKDKDFIGRLYYKNRPIEDTLRLLLNIIERQQDEIDTWEETENDYEHELARNNEQIKRQQREIEKLQKDKKVLIKNYDKVLGTFIAKDKIREAIKNREIELYADNPENNFIPFDKVIDTLKELLEDNENNKNRRR